MQWAHFPPPPAPQKRHQQRWPLVGSRIYSVIYFPANCSQCHRLWALVQKHRNEITDWQDHCNTPVTTPLSPRSVTPIRQQPGRPDGDNAVFMQPILSPQFRLPARAPSFIFTLGVRERAQASSLLHLHSRFWREGPEPQIPRPSLPISGLPSWFPAWKRAPES